MWRPAGQGRARLSRSDSMHVLTRIGQARQSRYFAVSRTGEWPRGKAEQLRYEYLHRAWGVLLAEGAVFLALTPLAPNWLREFIVGDIVDTKIGSTRLCQPLRYELFHAISGEVSR